MSGTETDRPTCPPQSEGLLRSVGVLPGVGPARESKLDRLGVRTLRDLLLLRPRELEEWTAPIPIADLVPDTDIDQRCAGRIVRSSFLFGRGRRRSLMRAVIADESGELEISFFNQPWLRERFVKGVLVDVRGRFAGSKGAFVASRFGTDDSPLPAPGTLVPIYPATDGIGQELLRGWIGHALDAHADELSEPLDRAMLAQVGWPGLDEAVQALHRPADRASWELAATRIALEPILTLQARLAARRAAVVQTAAPCFELTSEERTECEGALPFTLTAGQTDCLEEILKDLARGVPMRPPVAGRRRLRQDGARPVRLHRLRAFRSPVGVSRADRAARRTARGRPRRLDRARRPADRAPDRFAPARRAPRDRSAPGER